MQKTNLLHPAFYTKLIYNGPPCTRDESDLFRLLAGSIGLEFAIVNAIDSYGVDLFYDVVNPSEKVIVRAIGHRSSIINAYANPTTDMKLASMLHDPQTFCPRFLPELTEDDLIKLVKLPSVGMFGKYGYECAKYILNLSDRVKWTIIKDHPWGAKCIDDMTTEMCEYVADHVSYLDDGILSKFKEFTPKIVQKIMSARPCLIKWIPTEYYTPDLMIKCIGFNHSNLKDIPKEFLTQDLCDMATSMHALNLEFVPKEFQTDLLVKKCIKSFPQALVHCINITHDLVVFTFKNEGGCKVNRLKFVNHYAQKDIIRIARVYPNILRILLPKNKTDEVIRIALQSSGWVIQYVDIQTAAYVHIALKSEPKAVKYVNAEFLTQTIEI